MSVEQRISKLERQLKIQRRVGACCAAALALALFVASGEPAKGAADLVGRSLKLKDEDGKIWLRAGPDHGGGFLKLEAHKTEATLELRVADEQQHVFMYRGRLIDGTYRPQLTMKAAGHSGQIAVFRDIQSIVGYIGEHPDGGGAAFVTDESNKTTWIAPAKARKFEEVQKRSGGKKRTK